MIEIVSATRLSQSDFWKNSALGNSLRRLTHDNRLVPRISFGNSRGLPEIYNAHISMANGHDMLAFVHDDVWIDDYFLADRIIDGLQAFDVIGVAGNKRRVPSQPAWAFVGLPLQWDDRSQLTGSVAHGKYPFGAVSYFGPVPAECELLDGVFLACRKSTLTSREVLFDPTFDFHFYDMDFCRTARRQGLRLGTWPICLTHQSGGAFGSPRWSEKHALYIKKWND